MRVWVFSVLSLSVLGLSPNAAYGQGWQEPFTWVHRDWVEG